MESSVKNVLRSAVGLAVCGLLSASIAAQDGGLDVVKVRKNFYMIAGAGGNIGVQIGSDGIVLVNTGAAATTDKVLAALKTADRPADPLHHQRRCRRGLRRRQREAGARGLHDLHQRARRRRRRSPDGGGASILSHDSVLRRMSGGQAAVCRAVRGRTRRSSRRARPSA